MCANTKGRKKRRREEMFKHPFTMCVAGCTGSGKSQWVDRLLSHIDLLVSEGPITGVLYCYGEVNDNVLRLQRMESATNDNNMEGKHSVVSQSRTQIK